MGDLKIISFLLILLFFSCTSPSEKEKKLIHAQDSLSNCTSPKDSVAINKSAKDTSDFSDTSWFVFTVSDKKVFYRHAATHKIFSNWNQVDSLIEKEGVAKLDNKMVLAVDSTNAFKRVHTLLDLMKKNKVVHFKLVPPLEE